MSSRSERQAKKDEKAARNAQIVARIKAGEKRYMLAEEYQLNPTTIGLIGERGGIPPFRRFPRQVNN